MVDGAVVDGVVVEAAAGAAAKLRYHTKQTGYQHRHQQLRRVPHEKEHRS